MADSRMLNSFPPSSAVDDLRREVEELQALIQASRETLQRIESRLSERLSALDSATDALSSAGSLQAEPMLDDVSSANLTVTERQFLGTVKANRGAAEASVVPAAQASASDPET